VYPYSEPNMERLGALRKLDFYFLSRLMGYHRGDSFPFDFELNGISFCSKSKGKLSPRSYPIQCERKRKYSFRRYFPSLANLCYAYKEIQLRLNFQNVFNLKCFVLNLWFIFFWQKYIPLLPNFITIIYSSKIRSLII